MLLLPSSDLTANPVISDLTGLLAPRLYLNLRTTAMLAIMSTKNVTFGVDMAGNSSLFTVVDALCMAIAVEVVSEIKSHSNLGALVRDQGPAGAGIIVGWCK